MTKHTLGPVSIVGGNVGELTLVVKPGDGIVSHIATLNDSWICDEHGGSAFDNALLISDAFNIATETGMTPRELADSHARLLEACQFFIKQLSSGMLVRDIQKDIDSDWTLRMLEFIENLNKANAAVYTGSLSNEEKSLLLYLETRFVDHGGLVDSIHMNARDFEIAEEWNKSGFLKFGRVIFKDAKRLSRGLHKHTYWVELTALAWNAAHEERKNRAARLWKKRTWKKTEEKIHD